MAEARIPFVPEYITVHLGAPDADVPDVTVPFADYIKNVASGEIYPTWPESALRANIIAQITFAMNRVYTEYYRSRGYFFDITNSTAFDQSYAYGREVFENISNLTDEIIGTYMRREGRVEPIFALYCDGRNTTCAGLSQWGSVSLANQGFTPEEILRRYYGDNIAFVTNAPIKGEKESYPGRILRIGSVGDDVRFVQIRLNRISRNYPTIPKINPVDGVFTNDTESAVRGFQDIFYLPYTGEVDRSTWYAILRVYAAVKSLSDLNSEGIVPEEITNLFAETLSLGYRGKGTVDLQYFLRFVGEFDENVIQPEITGVFGEETERAVKSFQSEYGLPVTGIVDVNTWEILFSTYTGLLDSLPPGYFNDITKPYPGFPIRIGSVGEPVERIQTYLDTIAMTYTQIPRLDIDGIFGQMTDEAVKAYQRLVELPVTGIVGIETYQSIADTYRSLVDGAKSSSGQFGGTLSANAE